MSESTKASDALDVPATHALAPGQDAGPGDQVDVLVIGAGVTGIYQLHQAREAGFSVRLLEAGSGVGGTWYWNRYPEARFDSESYTYGYLFSKELWEEWEWSEQFAGQPEIERYFNHVVDRFDLRRHIRFNTKVTSAVWDEQSGTWSVGTADGARLRARFLVAATGILSVPFIPAIPGREHFRGEQHHTGRWPKEPVDFSGKRVAQIGTGSSGVQIISAIADDVAQLTVYQKVADWLTPLNNAPITPEEQAELKANFESIRDTLKTSPSGFLHQITMRSGLDDTPEQRQEFYETKWNSPGFTKLSEHYMDMLSNPTVNAEWCEFMARKIRGIVKDPKTAEKLIPKDHGYGGRRPPSGPATTRRTTSRTSPSSTSTRHRSSASPRRGSKPPKGCRSSTSSSGRPDTTSAPAHSSGLGCAAGRVSPLRTTGRRVRAPTSGSRPPVSRTSSSPAGRTARRATTRGTPATRSTSSWTRWSVPATRDTTSSRRIPPPSRSGRT